MPFPNVTINDVCSILTDTKRGSELQRYADVNELILKLSKLKCLDYKYDKYITDMRKPEWRKEFLGGKYHLFRILINSLLGYCVGNEFLCLIE